MNTVPDKEVVFVYKWKIFLITGSLIGIFGLWIALSEETPQPPSPPPLPREDSRDPKIHALFQMKRIHNVLTTALTAKMYIELSRFSSPEEYLQSPYLAVLPQDLINPYTGKPVRAVPGIWKDEKEFRKYFIGAPPPTVPLERLGNLAFTDFGSRFLVELYTEPYLLDGKTRISLYFYVGKGKISLAKMSPETRDSRQRYEKMYEKTKGSGFFSRMNDTDKRLFSISMYLDQFISTLAEPPGLLTTPPDYLLTLEELQTRFPLLHPNVKNPYTNQPIQFVSYYNPSPGNCTIIFLANEMDNTIVGSDLLCYDEQSRYIAHWSFFAEDMLNGQKVGGYKLILR